MSWILSVIGVAITLTSLNWGLRQKKKLKRLEVKYAPVIDVDKYVENKRRDIDEYISEEKNELELMIHDEKDILEKEKVKYEKTFCELQISITETEKEQKLLKNEMDSMYEKIELASDDAELIDYGFYNSKFDFEFDGDWKKELEQIKARQKSLISGIKQFSTHHDLTVRSKRAAAYRTQDLYFDNSVKKGEKVQLNLIKLMIRAFNGECDVAIAKVNWKNIELQRKRINASHQAINKIGENAYLCTISNTYRALKIYELEAYYEYEEWKQKEKEEQRRIREQIKEEERALKEIEKAKLDAEKEEKRYQQALDNARNEVAGANEKQKEKLLKQIAELEVRMKEMEEKKRSISQAEITKTGHVYIISNVGSFGEDMFKIGMTRRLEPLDRVKELGDASVPFPFDIHAMIRTSDAPSLEKALHKQFDQKRVNLENNRKEFFYVSIQEIQEQLRSLKTELGIESEFQLTMLAEAKQYRQSEAKRIHLQKIYENS